MNAPACNSETVDLLRRVGAAHLKAQRALFRIREGEGGEELLDQALAELGDDVEARAAFARSVSRARRPA